MIQLILILFFFLPLNFISEVDKSINVALNQGCILIILYLIVISYICINRREIYSKNMIIFFYLIVIMILSISLNNIKNLNNNSEWLNYLELYRPFLFLGAYLLGEIKFIKLKKIFSAIIKIIILMIILYILYIFYPELYNRIAIYYTKLDNIYRIRRFTAVFPNPYDTAYFLNYIYLLITYLIFKGKKIYIFINIFIVIMLISTLSRTGVIIFGLNNLIFMIILLFNSKDNKIKYFLKKYILLCVFMMIVIFHNLEFFSKKFPYIYIGLRSLILNGVSGTSSINNRFQQFLLVKESLEKNLFLGIGINKIINLYTEGMYSLYLYRYGILGGFFVAILLIITIKEGYRSFKKSKDDLESALGIAFFIMSMTNIICFFTNNYPDQVRNNFFFYFIFGVITKRNRYLKKLGGNRNYK